MVARQRLPARGLASVLRPVGTAVLLRGARRPERRRLPQRRRQPRQRPDLHPEQRRERDVVPDRGRRAGVRGADRLARVPERAARPNHGAQQLPQPVEQPPGYACDPRDTRRVARRPAAARRGRDQHVRVGAGANREHGPRRRSAAAARPRGQHSDRSTAVRLHRTAQRGWRRSHAAHAVHAAVAAPDPARLALQLLTRRRTASAAPARRPPLRSERGPSLQAMHGRLRSRRRFPPHDRSGTAPPAPRRRGSPGTGVCAGAAIRERCRGCCARRRSHGRPRARR